MLKMLTALAAAVAVSSTALAADMPVKSRVAPQQTVPPGLSWTGFYVGVDGGYGWGTKSFDKFCATKPDDDCVAPVAPFDPLHEAFRHDQTGFLLGGVVGANLQIYSWVVGIEGGVHWADISGDKTITVAGLDVETKSRVKFLAEATAKLGYLVQPNLLVYGKGGFAWDRSDYSASTAIPGDGAAIPVTWNATQNRTGWTAGAGAEWAVTSNWSFKVEYQYYDFGTKQVRAPVLFNGTAFVDVGMDVEQNLHTVKGGLNYRF